MPHLKSLGFPSQYQGPEKIHGFFNYLQVELRLTIDPNGLADDKVSAERVANGG